MAVKTIINNPVYVGKIRYNVRGTGAKSSARESIRTRSSSTANTTRSFPKTCGKPSKLCSPRSRSPRHASSKARTP
ncbi:hypothetical protein [Paenibacillus harenae]|uniref:hypothetical protein n=1 Tax=Paenibacillus harenae TaxID=306543 RepID=UPI00146F0588